MLIIKRDIIQINVKKKSYQINSSYGNLYIGDSSKCRYLIYTKLSLFHFVLKLFKSNI